jgi:hypothetical protein
VSDETPTEGSSLGEASDRTRALRAVAVAVVLLLGVAWTFRALIGEDPTRTTPLNNASPYAWSSVDQRTTRLSMGTDQRFVIWLFERNARSWLTRPWAMFDAEICHPEPQALALGEPALTMGLIAIPAWLVSGDPILVYNFVVVMLPLITGLAMFLLIRDWTGHDGAAATAAVLYALHIVKLADVVHPYATDTGWTVLAFLFVRRWLESGRWRDVLGLAAVVSLQIGGSLYALIGAAMLGALVAIHALVCLGLRKTSPAQWAVLVLVLAGAAYFAFAPFIAKAAGGTLSDRPLQLFLPWASVMPGATGFPGWMIIFLALAAFLPMAREPESNRYGPRWILLAGVVIVLVLAAGGNAGDRLVAELGGREPPRALPNPYHLLGAILPGFSAIRAPLWVATSAHMGLCVLAGLGAARALSRVPLRYASAASIGLVALAFVYTLRVGFPDSHAYHPQPMSPPDHLLRFYEELEEKGNRGPVIEMPVDDLGLGRGSMSIMMAAYHHRRTSRCYNSYFSAGVQQAWDLAKALPDPEVVRGLGELGFTTVVIHHPPIKKDMLALVQQIDELAGEGDLRLELVHRNPVMSAYRIPTGADAP